MTDDVTYGQIVQLKQKIKKAKDKNIKTQLKEELKEANKRASTYGNIFNKVSKVRKEQEKNKQKKKTDGDVEMQQMPLRLKSQSSNVLDEEGENLTFNKNLELKLDSETGQYYLEKKWNVEKDTQIGNCMKIIYNSWLFSPTTFFIW